MIDFREDYNNAINNIRSWKNSNERKVYVHRKLLTNIMFRAISVKGVYDAFLRNELPHFPSTESSLNYIEEYYDEMSKEVHPELIEWLRNFSNDEMVGTVNFHTYKCLAYNAEINEESVHELEFIYVFEHLNDICVLLYISYIIAGMSPREAIEKISGTECPTLPNNDLGSQVMLPHSDIIDDEIKSLLATLPGFRDYQERLPDPDLESLLTKYEQSLRQSDKLTYGIRTNIKLIKRKYNERKNKASGNSPEKKDENGEFPAWAALMTSEELGNINSLTNRLPALAKFLQNYSSNRNFTEVISLFEEEHMKELRQQRPMRYIVDSIKKYFQSIMEKRVGALHFVSTEHCVNDKELLQEFFKDAKDNFFSKDLNREDCQDCLLRYIHSMHPYIDAEIGNRYLKYGQYKVAFVFYTHIFRHIFSSPNLYWHNPEGIYGCASYS